MLWDLFMLRYLKSQINFNLKICVLCPYFSNHVHFVQFYFHHGLPPLWSYSAQSLTEMCQKKTFCYIHLILDKITWNQMYILLCHYPFSKLEDREVTIFNCEHYEGKSKVEDRKVAVSRKVLLKTDSKHFLGLLLCN